MTPLPGGAAGAPLGPLLAHLAPLLVLDPATTRLEPLLARRPAFRCRAEDGRSWFVKLPFDAGDLDLPGLHHLQMERAAMSREAAMMSALAVRPFTALRLPQFVLLDPDSGALVSEYMDGSRPLATTELSDDQLHRMRHLAASLAELHGTADITIDPDLALEHGFAGVIAHLDGLNHLTPHDVSAGTGVDWRVFAAAAQAVGGELATLRREWEPRALIHGDLRFENILVGDSGTRIIDWEMAGRGDPHLDVATVLAGTIKSFVGQLPTAHGPDAARENWRCAAALSVTFLDAYQSKVPTGDRLDPERTARWVGVVLFLEAAARLEQAGSLGMSGRLYLQLGTKFLRSPGDRINEFQRVADAALTGAVQASA